MTYGYKNPTTNGLWSSNTNEHTFVTTFLKNMCRLQYNLIHINYLCGGA